MNEFFLLKLPEMPPHDLNLCNKNRDSSKTNEFSLFIWLLVFDIKNFTSEVFG